MALAIAVFGYAFYQEEVKIERQHIMTRDPHHVELQQAILTDALTNAFDALAFIAGQARPHRPFSYPEGRRQLGADFISFLRIIPAFDQVRLLDMRGREFIRANQTRAGPRLVPDAELQDKSGHYYFRETRQLARGRIYLSALDLNMEHGEVGRPFKPMIRLAVPAFEGERKVGIVVLNLRMANVLAHFQQVNHMGESEGYLLNPDGFFLSSPHTKWNWGFMLPHHHNQSFAVKFPQAWQRISGRDRGQFEEGGDLFSFAAFDPLQALKDLPGFSAGDGVNRHRWITVSRVSASTFARTMAPERRQYLSGTAILMLVAALLAGILAWLHTQKTEARKLLDESRRTLAHVMSSTPAVHYACRAEGNRFIPTFVSLNLKELFGWDPDAVTGDAEWWGSHLHPEDRERIVEGFRVALGEGREKHVHEYRFRHAGGHYPWVHDELTIEYDADGRPVEIIGSWLDITERRQAEEKIESALREKEALLREIHHRVKNNMQIISSLLKLQASHVEDAHLREMYRDSQNRIRAMSMVHEQLYAAAMLGAIRGQAYLENVVFSLVRSYSISAQHIAVHVDAGEIFLNMDEAIPCGLIVNELVSNALKYAFAGESGEIKVSLTMPDDEYRLLRVYDNGCGLPPDLDIRESKTLGLQLVDTLAEQLGGELTVNCEHGTDVRILFPADKEENT